MSTYVLVHGPFHGAWCWDKLLPHLLHTGDIEVVADQSHARQRLAEALVYISGLVPLNGQNAFDLIGQNAELRSKLVLNEAEGWGSLQRDAVPDLYYHDCRPEDVTTALARLRVVRSFNLHRSRPSGTAGCPGTTSAAYRMGRFR